MLKSKPEPEGRERAFTSFQRLQLQRDGCLSGRRQADTVVYPQPGYPDQMVGVEDERDAFS